MIKHLLTVAFVSYLYLQRQIFLPHGPAACIAKVDLRKFSELDKTNDSLITNNKKLTKIFERDTTLIKGPETPVIDSRNGKLYVLTEDANLVSLTEFEPLTNANNVSSQAHTKSSRTKLISAEATLVADLGVGRPLGGKFDSDGTLYIADAVLGLTRVKHIDGDGMGDGIMPKVELVVSQVIDEDGSLSNIAYANDVDIGSQTGHVYFTDSTDIAPERVQIKTWDTMVSFKRDLLRGTKMGRLIRYKPETDEVDILASNIGFANGVAIDAEETFVMISETTTARQLKYHLKGRRTGTLEVMMDDLLPGYPDGGACSPTTGLCYAPMPSIEVPILRIIAKSPSEWLSAFVRTVLLMMPRQILSAILPVPYGGVAEIFPGDENGDSGGRVMRILQDSFGEEIAMITGVAVHDDRLYLGSLKNNFIGVFEL